MKLDPSRFQVVEHKPGYRILVALGCIVVAVACVVGGYFLGNETLGQDKASIVHLNQALDERQATIEKLTSELTDARLSTQISTEAAVALRQDMTDLRQTGAALREEVTFYKSLMAPGSLAQGLQVSELKILPGADAGTFKYELLLTQIALRRQYISGSLRIEVIGVEGASTPSAEVVLPLTELSDLEDYPVKFRFRYFQGFAGTIALPDGFAPHRVRVVVRQKGKDVLEVGFAWPAEPGNVASAK